MRDQPVWTPDSVLEIARSYQAAAVLAAGADLEVFAYLRQPSTAAQVAAALQCDPRGLIVLLDVLTSLGLLVKTSELYSLAPGVEHVLTPDGGQSVLAMAQHQANCMRRWAQLAVAVKSGFPPPSFNSVRGERRDQEAFIGAMDNISAPNADKVIASIEPARSRHFLDVGGASGTWTAAFLRANPTARATLFDLPQVIPMAERRLQHMGFLDRVGLVPGDFYTDPLPSGADLAWVSAIVHQNSRKQNRELFTKVHRALEPGGRIAIRDIVMEPDRCHPVAGALFAVNMLVATPGGGTFTFEELKEDLLASGFTGPYLAREDEAMNSVLIASKP